MGLIAKKPQASTKTLLTELQTTYPRQEFKTCEYSGCIVTRAVELSIFCLPFENYKVELGKFIINFSDKAHVLALIEGLM